MRRPCAKYHDLRPLGDGCAWCDKYYRGFWELERDTLCVHLGKATGERRIRLNCRADPPTTVAVRACALHGACSPSIPARETACCRYCPDRTEPPPGWGMLVTGGIGDLFVIEARVPDADRAGLERLYYAAPAAKEMRELMGALPNYSRLQTHIVLPIGNRVHYGRRSVERRHGKLPPGVQDWSVGVVFPRQLPYVGSSFLAHGVADPDEPPAPYVVVVPHSTWGRWPDRDFSADDWRTCFDFLDREHLYGVVLCRERLPVPEHPRLLDWQGRTTILETVELVKRAEGYVGVDSCLSCLAAMRFPPERLSIKGFNPFLLAWLGTYYGPHEAFPFLNRHLQAPAWMSECPST